MIRTTDFAPGLPERCLSVHPTKDIFVSLWRGERGYSYATSLGCLPGLTLHESADEYNRRLGVTIAQRMAMEAGSMFGWSVPGADPANYDAYGYFKKAR